MRLHARILPSLKSNSPSDVYLGELEQQLLLIVLRLGDEAYANPIGERAGKGRRPGRFARSPLYGARTARTKGLSAIRPGRPAARAGRARAPLLHGAPPRDCAASASRAACSSGCGKASNRSWSRRRDPPGRPASRNSCWRGPCGRRLIATTSSAISTNRMPPSSLRIRSRTRDAGIGRTRFDSRRARSSAAPIPFLPFNLRRDTLWTAC